MAAQVVSGFVAVEESMPMRPQAVAGFEALQTGLVWA